ncbi:MAG: NifU family protein [Planctomycetota bacterium]|nr:NifU family protein [Planctomycetota bacterium]
MDQEGSLTDRVRRVMQRLAPALSVDGGGVELVRIEGDSVYFRWTGACIGCPGTDLTLRYGLESTITEEIPEIKRVVPIGAEEEEPDS